MKIQIEDDELLSEMEDLYLQSKHWISDLEFLERNLEFIKKLYGKAFSQLVRAKESLLITEILSGVSDINRDHNILKADVITYLRTLGLLIKNPDQMFGMSLIRTHADIALRLDKIFEDFHLVKEIVMSFAKNAVKEEHLSLAMIKREIENSPEFHLLPVPFLSMDETELTEQELEHFCYSPYDAVD